LGTTDLAHPTRKTLKNFLNVAHIHGFTSFTTVFQTCEISVEKALEGLTTVRLWELEFPTSLVSLMV